MLLQTFKLKIGRFGPVKIMVPSAYRSKTDERDRHYHEFEDWQFDWLLEKQGGPSKT